MHMRSRQNLWCFVHTIYMELEEALDMEPASWTWNQLIKWLGLKILSLHKAKISFLMARLRYTRIDFQKVI